MFANSRVHLAAEVWGWTCSPDRKMSMCRMCFMILAMEIVWCMYLVARSIRFQRTSWPDYLDDYVSWIEKFSRSKGLVYDLIHSHYWLSGEAARSLKD